MKKCYFCGENANTDEHVPPKCFFPSEFRNQLLTVPSCRKHNEGFTKVDERCFIYIQAASGSKIAYDIFVNKTDKNLSHEKKRGLKKSLDDEYEVFKIDDKEIHTNYIDVKYFNQFFEKIVKGLYYHHFREVINGKIVFFLRNILDDIEKYIEAEHHFNNMDNNGMLITGKNSNASIFQYKYCIYKSVFYVNCLFYTDVQVYLAYKIEEIIK